MDYEVSDAEIEALVAVSLDPKIMARRKRAVEQLFEDNAVHAAAEIVSLATSSPNEKIRLDAAKYVVERVLGKIEASKVEAGTNPWEEVLGTVYKEPSKYELGN